MMNTKPVTIDLPVEVTLSLLGRCVGALLRSGDPVGAAEILECLTDEFSKSAQFFRPEHAVGIDDTADELAELATALRVDASGDGTL